MIELLFYMASGLLVLAFICEMITIAANDWSVCGRVTPVSSLYYNNRYSKVTFCGLFWNAIAIYLGIWVASTGLVGGVLLPLFKFEENMLPIITLLPSMLMFGVLAFILTVSVGILGTFVLIKGVDWIVKLIVGVDIYLKMSVGISNWNEQRKNKYCPIIKEKKQ